MKSCNSCAALVINGIYCHEHGCPEAWRDQSIDCYVCGFEFTPETRYAKVCPDCSAEDCRDE